MRPTPRRLASALALLLSACVADQEAIDICPDGKLIVDGEVEICVTNVVTETGFLCSGQLPYQYDLDGQVICANTPGLTIAALREAVETAHVPADEPAADFADAGPDLPDHADPVADAGESAAASGPAPESEPEPDSDTGAGLALPESDPDAREDAEDAGIDGGDGHRADTGGPTDAGNDDVAGHDAHDPDSSSPEDAGNASDSERRQADAGTDTGEPDTDLDASGDADVRLDPDADTTDAASDQGTGDNDEADDDEADDEDEPGDGDAAGDDDEAGDDDAAGDDD